jgi:hypothetical protein
LLLPLEAGRYQAEAVELRAIWHDRVVRKLAVVVIVLSFVGVAGCGSGAGAVRPVTVKGLLVWPDRSLPMTFHPVPTAGTVEFLQRGHVVADVKVGATGRFKVGLKPGTYQVRGSPEVKSSVKRKMVATEVCATRRPIVVGTHSGPRIKVECHFIGAAPG